MTQPPGRKKKMSVSSSISMALKARFRTKADWPSRKITRRMLLPGFQTAAIPVWPCREGSARGNQSLMSSIEITQVRSRADRDAFIKFPWRIYANDPVWVPPLIIERKGFLDQKKHPFFEHGSAALFLARRGGELVGRIMASDDPNYNSLHHTNVGCFGLFECIDDRKVAAALFAAAEDWLRRKGRHEIMGPIDYSTNYVCGLLIAGFQFPPTILTAHNPPYYAELIEGCGFEKRIDFYAWWFS